MSRFYTEACLFILYFILCTTALLLNREYYSDLVKKDFLHESSSSAVTTHTNETHETHETNETHTTIMTMTTAVSTSSSSSYTYCFDMHEEGVQVTSSCECVYLYPSDSRRYVNAFFLSFWYALSCESLFKFDHRRYFFGPQKSCTLLHSVINRRPVFVTFHFF